jgi:hypothetical protein
MRFCANAGVMPHARRCPCCRATRAHAFLPARAQQCMLDGGTAMAAYKMLAPPATEAERDAALVLQSQIIQQKCVQVKQCVFFRGRNRPRSHMRSRVSVRSFFAELVRQMPTRRRRHLIIESAIHADIDACGIRLPPELPRYRRVPMRGYAQNICAGV